LESGVIVTQNLVRYFADVLRKVMKM
jgi:hypothetical protein